MVLGSDSPLRLNSALVEVAEEMVTLDPVAVKVAVTLLLVPTATLPKFKVLALEVNCPAGTPLPARAIASFGFDAFESTAIPPLTFPPSFGVKRTLKVTLCPLFRLRGKLRPYKLNPAPVTVACEIVTVELAELVNISCWVRLLPTWILPKLTLSGLAARSLPLVEAEVATLPANIRTSGIVNTTIRSRETARGNDMTPVLSLRGLDHRSS